MKGLGLCIAAVCGFSAVVFAQEGTWREAIEEGKNFYEVQKAFEQEWAQKSGSKRGQGYKPFKRWEYYMDQRLYPSGDFGLLQTSYNEDARLRSLKGSQEKNGDNWQPLGIAEWMGVGSSGYNPGNGRINYVAIKDNNPNEIYVGAPTGGLWHSADGGGSWEPLLNDYYGMGVSAIAFHPDNSDIMFIGTGDRDAGSRPSLGVWKSEDAGQTWETTGLAFSTEENERIHEIYIDPANPDVMLAATGDGIYRTVNAGYSWDTVENGVYRELVVHPTNPDIMYAAGIDVVRSLDGGLSWDDIDFGYSGGVNITRLCLAVSPAEPDAIFVSAAVNGDNQFGGLFYSGDAGDTWEMRSNSPNLMSYPLDGSGNGGQAWYDMDLTVDPSDSDHMYSAGINMWESTDGGVSWLIDTHWYYPPPNSIGYVHADVHYAQYIGETLWYGTDGGVFKSEDNGQTFQDLSAGLEISEFYRLGVDPQDATRVLAGAQDNGINLLEDGDWLHIRGADGMECLISPNDPDRMYAAIQFGRVSRSDDGGFSFFGVSSSAMDDEDGNWVTPFKLSPVNPNILFVGKEQLHRSLNGGDNFTDISDFGNTSNFRINDFDVSAANPNRIYVCRNDAMFTTANGGVDWEEIGDGLIGTSHVSIITHPTDENQVWVVASGFEAGEKVYHSADAGITWENITLNLPNVPFNDIIFVDNGNEALYLASDLGVWYTDNNTANWENYSAGLPPVEIMEVEYNAADDMILCATYGRGVYISPAFELSSALPEADFTSNRTRICEGDAIQFFDASTNNAPSWEWSFPGGTPSTSTEHLPTIVYETAGVYPVTLTVNNPNGTDTKSVSSYLTVESVENTFPFFEGFEETTALSNERWELQTTLEGVNWELTDVTAFAGEKCIYVNNSTLNDKYLYSIISPPFDLSLVNSARIDIEYAFVAMEDNDNDKLRLFVSTDCGETWEQKKLWQNSQLETADNQVETFVPNGEEEWDDGGWNVTSPYRVNGFRFKLEFENDNGNNIYVDNINLDGELSISELESVSIDVYPNPASEEVQVELGEWANAENLSYEIVDISGRIVASANMLSGSNIHRIDVSQLTTGSYTLIVNSAKGKAQEVLIVE